MTQDIRIYSASNIKLLNWPDSESGRLGKSYLLPLLIHGTKHYINNVDTELLVLSVGDSIIPLTVNNQEWSNSYVCSPYTHYITYAKEEVHKLKNKPLEMLLNILLFAIDRIVKSTRINKVVMVNNWLFSTNIYPEISAEQIHLIATMLRNTFPQHAIVFRSIDTFRSNKILQILKKEGFSPVATRKVYFWDPSKSLRSKHARKYIRGDKSVARQTDYDMLTSNDLQLKDSTRMKKLYDLLYIHKYSLHNLQFNENFFQLVLNQNVLQVHVLRKKLIDGVIIYYQLNGVLVSPIVGYDTGLAKTVGLYRMLLLDATNQAHSSDILFHASSGVGGYKINRGSIGAMEYNLVYTRHLPMYRRFGWKLIQRIVDAIAVPLLSKYEL